MPFATRLATDLPPDRHRTVSSSHWDTFRLVRTIRPHPDRQSITARRFFIFPGSWGTSQSYISWVQFIRSIQSDRTAHRMTHRMQDYNIFFDIQLPQRAAGSAFFGFLLCAIRRKLCILIVQYAKFLQIHRKHAISAIVEQCIFDVPMIIKTL